MLRAKRGRRHEPPLGHVERVLADGHVGEIEQPLRGEGGRLVRRIAQNAGVLLDGPPGRAVVRVHRPPIHRRRAAGGRGTGHAVALHRQTQMGQGEKLPHRAHERGRDRRVGRRLAQDVIERGRRLFALAGVEPVPRDLRAVAKPIGQPRGRDHRREDLGPHRSGVGVRLRRNGGYRLETRHHGGGAGFARFLLLGGRRKRPQNDRRNQEPDTSRHWSPTLAPVVADDASTAAPRPAARPGHGNCARIWTRAGWPGRIASASPSRSRASPQRPRSARASTYPIHASANCGSATTTCR